ncbi:hypothetical protein ABB55_27230 [Prosthecomicrobium hirschii]|uniref:Toprim domain-containing protein n=2 Tax=Prosthecodimorpha hirschii TaxID=665126 RepID=A0A0N8GFW7_9HYPH|nr:hypothetical protein ABB55_27230 [Prosthecomicrobium hirschii]
MVALVRDVLTDRPMAIHRTAIDKNGKKLSHLGANGRLALGPCSGGAVKLTPDAEVTLCLGVGEGIESTLSLRYVPEFGRSPVWALLNAGQVEAFPVIPGIEALWFAVDHDEAGIRASQRTAARWSAAGRESYLIAPTTAGADLNDMEAAHAA